MILTCPRPYQNQVSFGDVKNHWMDDGEAQRLLEGGGRWGKASIWRIQGAGYEEFQLVEGQRCCAGTVKKAKLLDKLTLARPPHSCGIELVALSAWFRIRLVDLTWGQDVSVRRVTSGYSQTHIESGGYLAVLFNDESMLLPVRVAHLRKTRCRHEMYEAR